MFLPAQKLWWGMKYDSALACCMFAGAAYHVRLLIHAIIKVSEKLLLQGAQALMGK